MSEALRQRLEKRINAAKKTIASKQAAIARAELDLANLADASARLEKQRQKKVSKGSGPRKVKEAKVAPEQNSDVVEKIEVPTIEMDLSAPAAAPAGQEKKKFGFF